MKCICLCLTLQLWQGRQWHLAIGAEDFTVDNMFWDIIERVISQRSNMNTERQSI